MDDVLVKSGRKIRRRCLHFPEWRSLPLIWGLILWGVLALFIHSAAQAADSWPSVSISVSVTPLSAPVIIAAERGYFAEEGVDVSLNQYIGGVRTADALLKGEVDAATTSEAVVMFNSFKRADFAIVASFVESDNDVKILTTRDSGIASVADLAGRKVGTILGASAHFFLDHTLLINGVPTEEVEVTAIHPEETPEAMLRGELDAVVSWEPFVHQTRQKLGAEARLVPHDKLYTETFNLVVMREWAQRHPEVLEAMMRGLIRATAYIHKHPQQAQAQVATFLNKDLSLIAATWNDLRFAISLHQWLISTLEAEARWAIERGFVDGDQVPNYLDFLLMDPLLKVAPRTITIIH